MQQTIEKQACSILNTNESEIETIKNNFKVIPMKKEAKEYAASFNSFAVKTAQTTLEMCRVVHDAKSDLSKPEFDKFCFAIGRKEEKKILLFVSILRLENAILSLLRMLIVCLTRGLVST